MSIDTSAQQRARLPHSAPAQATGVKGALLACGVVSAALWIGTDIIASFLYEGYSYKEQTISELAAIDAPSRPYVVPMVLVYAALLILFGRGVWEAGARNRPLRATGALLIAHGLVNLALTPFSPMHQREVLQAGGGTFSDTLHLIVAAENVLLFLLVIGLGAAAIGGRFRVFSIATIVTAIVFGALTAVESQDVAANNPTPWIGITERVSAYSFMVWTMVLAAALLRSADSHMTAGAHTKTPA